MSRFVTLCYITNLKLKIHYLPLNFPKHILISNELLFTLHKCKSFVAILWLDDVYLSNDTDIYHMVIIMIKPYYLICLVELLTYLTVKPVSTTIESITFQMSHFSKSITISLLKLAIMQHLLYIFWGSQFVLARFHNNCNS